MNSKQQAILAAIASTQLISDEMKFRIQTGINHFSEAELDQIIEVIKDSLQTEQNILFQSSLKKNPELIQDMKQVIKEEARRDLQQKEEAIQESETKDLDLDSELESVFSNTQK